MQAINLYKNSLKYGIRNVYLKKIKRYQQKPYNEKAIANIEDFIKNISSNTIVLFCGLKQLKYNMGISNPAGFIFNIVTKNFENIIVPTFTSYVSKSKVFDVKNSPSENGAFSNYFLKNADFRTSSPLKSFAVIGPIKEKLKLLQTTNDYDKNGIYSFLYENYIPTLNIGVDFIRFKSLHYLEYLHSVPYARKKDIDVKVTSESGKIETIKHTALLYRRNYKFNAKKLEQELLEQKALTIQNNSGVIMRYIPEKNYFDYFDNELKENCFYLIS